MKNSPPVTLDEVTAEKAAHQSVSNIHGGVPGGWEGPWLSVRLSTQQTQRDGPINRGLFILAHLNFSAYLLTNVSHV